MRGRGRVQLGSLGSLGTLLPRQASRPRTAAGPAAARADTAPDCPAEQTSTDPTTTERASTGWANADKTASAHTAASGAVANTERWRTAATTAASGSGKRAARTAAAVASRSTALRYAAWGWPVTPSTALPATADLEQVFATWSRLPDAPILAACGVAFDVIETHALAGRAALARLDRLGVDLGPVTLDSVGRIGFLVRADSAAQLSSLIDLGADRGRGPGHRCGPGPGPGSGPALIGRGAHFELPRTLDQPEPYRPPATAGRFWLRPPGTPRPALPTAHVVLGALALVPYRALAAASLGR